MLLKLIHRVTKTPIVCNSAFHLQAVKARISWLCPFAMKKKETLQSYSVQGRFHRLSILWENVVTNLGFVV